MAEKQRLILRLGPQLCSVQHHQLGAKPVPSAHGEDPGCWVTVLGSALGGGEPRALGEATSPAKSMLWGWELLLHVPTDTHKRTPVAGSSRCPGKLAGSHIPPAQGCTTLGLGEPETRHLLPSLAASSACTQAARSGLLIPTATAWAGSWLSPGTAGISQAASVRSL